MIEMGQLLAVELAEDLPLLAAGPAPGHEPEGASDAIFRVWQFANELLGQESGGFKELRIVEENQCLQRSGGHLALGGTDFAAGGVEGKHVWRWCGASPEGVQASAVKLLALVWHVMLAGSGFLPESGRLVRADARATKGGVEETADGERVVADLFGIEPVFGTARQESVIRITRYDVRGSDRGLAVRGRHYDQLMHGL